MKIKSYYSRSVEGALAAAREELGSDAMLLESRKASPEARHLGEYEVVVALTSDTPTSDSRHDDPATVAARDRLSQDVAELKKELEGMRRAITRTAFAPPQWLSGAPDLSDAYAVLTANEIDPDLAREIVQSAESRSAGGSRPRIAQVNQTRDSGAYQQGLIQEL